MGDAHRPSRILLRLRVPGQPDHMMKRAANKIKFQGCNSKGPGAVYVMNDWEWVPREMETNLVVGK